MNDFKRYIQKVFIYIHIRYRMSNLFTLKCKCVTYLFLFSYQNLAYACEDLRHKRPPVGHFEHTLHIPFTIVPCQHVMVSYCFRFRVVFEHLLLGKEMTNECFSNISF